MKLVFIHGRSQEGKDPVKLQRHWEDAFDEGLGAAGLSRPAGLTVELPFYADKLDELVDEADADLVEDAATKGADTDSAEVDFRGAWFAEMAEESNVTDADIQSHFKGDLQKKGVGNWEWVHSILKALDSTPLGSKAIDAFTRDVYVYLSYRAVRRAIDSIVAPSIAGPCVVVGHSLGSVVGFNVLRSIDPSVDVKSYITVGSPLGVKAVKEKLQKPLKMPSCTNNWYNAMDEGDVVALYPLDGKNFDIDPSIVNKTNVENDTDNQHGISGYLKDPDVARAISAALMS